MRRLRNALFAFGFLGLSFYGCAATSDTNRNVGGGNGSGLAGTGGTGGLMLGQGGGGSAPVSYPAHITGTVYAPEGSIPISGALVYVASAQPPPIPDGVYCDSCVHLPTGTSYTTTNPDGTFDLGAYDGAGYLVVQKGAFRRVRPITIAKGTQAAPKEMTTMPPKTDKANGDDVPKIAVVVGAWDPIEIVLARMGLEAKITSGFMGKPQVLGADAVGFAVYGLQALGETSPHPDAYKLVTDPAEIEQYHMVFFPCSGTSNLGSDGPACSGVWGGSASIPVVQNFVKKGGRVYTSDWSYEYVRQVFPNFITWQGESDTVGSACQSGGGSQSAPPVDTGLAAWLTAQGKVLDTVDDAWTYISSVNATPSTDATGKPTTETPKVWVHADGEPATTSFKYGCGRVLYTTYHTLPSSDSAAPLTPQTLALLYLVLEVGVCIDPNIPG